MKKYIFFFVCIFICNYSFSQGRIASCTVLYPEENVKEQLLLCNRVTKISLESPSEFRFEVNLEVINMAEDDLNCNLIYSHYLGPYERELKDNEIAVFLNNDKLVLKEIVNVEANDYVYECVIPKGFSTISYTIIMRGDDISRHVQGYVEYTNIDKWNISEEFLNKYYVNIFNQRVHLNDTKFEMLGKGKEKENTFHLKSGSLYYESSKKEESIHIETHRDGKYAYFVCGSGAPAVSEIPTDASCYFYKMQFISATKLINYVLEYGWNFSYVSDRLNIFIEMVKSYDKKQLRLLRNAFFAINDYAFKDPELRAFFSNDLDYFPDENITQDSIQKQKSDEILLEIIQSLENDKSVDEVLKKYGLKEE